MGRGDEPDSGNWQGPPLKGDMAGSSKPVSAASIIKVVETHQFPVQMRYQSAAEADAPQLFEQISQDGYFSTFLQNSPTSTLAGRRAVLLTIDASNKWYKKNAKASENAIAADIDQHLRYKMDFALLRDDNGRAIYNIKKKGRNWQYQVLIDPTTTHDQVEKERQERINYFNAIGMVGSAQRRSVPNSEIEYKRKSREQQLLDEGVIPLRDHKFVGLSLQEMEDKRKTAQASVDFAQQMRALQQNMQQKEPVAVDQMERQAAEVVEQAKTLKEETLAKIEREGEADAARYAEQEQKLRQLYVALSVEQASEQEISQPLQLDSTQPLDEQIASIERRIKATEGALEISKLQGTPEGVDARKITLLKQRVENAGYMGDNLFRNQRRELVKISQRLRASRRLQQQEEQSPLISQPFESALTRQLMDAPAYRK